MRIYHHTKFENLEKIVTPNGLSFRGSYYKEFCDADYERTQRVTSRIIERICKKRNVNYDKDTSFKPIIISFGIDADSDYMWVKYAHQYSGIQLILDYDIITKVSYDNLDYFGKCVYMRKRGRMKKFIQQKTFSVESINDIQSNLESVSALIKPTRFKKENEIRYIRAYSKIFEVCYEDFMLMGDKAFTDSYPTEKDDERFVYLPKETLLGIAIGYKSENKLNSVKAMLKEMNYDVSNVFIYQRE